MIDRCQGRLRKTAACLVAAALVAAVSAAAGTPGWTAPKDALVVGVPSDPEHFNALLANNSSTFSAAWSIFDCLVAYDENLSIKPALAQSWDVSRDGLSYTFHLRPNVLWHDGQPFTADDVAFWVSALLNPKVRAPSRAFYGAFAGYAALTDPDHPADPASLPKKPVEVLGPLTVRLNLAFPYAPFLDVLSCPGGTIVPKHVLEGQDINTAEFNTRPIGTGPFRMTEWRKGDHFTLQAFDRYYGGAPALRQVVFATIPDPVVRAQALKAGQIDVLDTPLYDDLPVYARDPRLALIGGYTTLYWYLGFRVDRPVFSDLRLRQAISYGVNFDVIVRKVFGDNAVRATGPIPPNNWAYTPRVRLYPYNPAKAKQLLAEAGYTPGPDGVMQKDGRPLAFAIKTINTDQSLHDVIVIIQSQLALIGVQAQVQLLDTATILRQMFSSDFDAILEGWNGHIDPDPINYTVWHSSQWNTRNILHYKNPEVDRLLDDARAALDQGRRRALYARFQQVLADDAPTVWGYYPKRIYVYEKQLRGLTFIPLQGGVYPSLRRAKWQP